MHPMRGIVPISSSPCARPWHHQHQSNFDRNPTAVWSDSSHGPIGLGVRPPASCDCGASGRQHRATAVLAVAIAQDSDHKLVWLGVRPDHTQIPIGLQSKSDDHNHGSDCDSHFVGFQPQSNHDWTTPTSLRIQGLTIVFSTVNTEWLPETMSRTGAHASGGQENKCYHMIAKYLIHVRSNKNKFLSSSSYKFLVFSDAST